MPYEVLADEVSVLKANDVYKDDDGKVTGYDHVGILCSKGDVLPDEDVSPVVQELYEAGDEHTLAVLKKLSDGAAKKKSDKDAETS